MKIGIFSAENAYQARENFINMMPKTQIIAVWPAIWARKEVA